MCLVEAYFCVSPAQKEKGRKTVREGADAAGCAFSAEHIARRSFLSARHLLLIPNAGEPPDPPGQPAGARAQLCQLPLSPVGRLRKEVPAGKGLGWFLF